jgi:PhzF family phenazine biosynthesis protein
MATLDEYPRPAPARTAHLEIEHVIRTPIYQVDAFALTPFEGNPAAVCPLEAWLPDATMQAIAAENNLPETAFFVPGEGGGYQLRWFTPAVEVDLCGHATLASAFVLLTMLRPDAESIAFSSASGPLTVRRGEGERLVLDFPSKPPDPCDPCEGLIAAMGRRPAEVLGASNYLLVYETQAQVAALKPTMAGLLDIDRDGVIATAPGDTHDFVSRYFFPAGGIDEDPVTGSAHCTLMPYWAKRLGRDALHARQISARGGELWCRLVGDRVEIAGHCVPYMRGEIEIPQTT